MSDEVRLGPYRFRRGATVTVDDDEPLQFTIDRIDRYECEGGQWWELSGFTGGERVHLEVYDDGDGVRFLLDSGLELDLATFGLDEDQLIAFDEGQDSSATLQARGRTWRFIESMECTWFDDGAGNGEGFWNWSFLAAGGPASFDDDEGEEELVLSVEKYADEPFELTVGRSIDTNCISVS
jgi:hypothetical protein